MGSVRLVTVLPVLLIGLGLCHGYVYLMLNATNPDFPGECFDPSTQIHFKPGQTRQRPLQCEEMTCGKDYSIEYYG